MWFGLLGKNLVVKSNMDCVVGLLGKKLVVGLGKKWSGTFPLSPLDSRASGHTILMHPKASHS